MLSEQVDFTFRFDTTHKVQSGGRGEYGKVTGIMEVIQYVFLTYK